MGSSFATLARSQGDVPLVAATPVQHLRFRANDLRADAKLTPAHRHADQPRRPRANQFVPAFDAV